MIKRAYLLLDRREAFVGLPLAHDHPQLREIPAAEEKTHGNYVRVQVTPVRSIGMYVSIHEMRCVLR